MIAADAEGDFWRKPSLNGKCMTHGTIGPLSRERERAGERVRPNLGERRTPPLSPRQKRPLKFWRNMAQIYFELRKLFRPSRLTAAALLAAILSAACATTRQQAPDAGSNVGTPGFYVKGRHLYDRCGDPVVLRGVNEMVVWTKNRDGIPEFDEIQKTGANAVRIVWNSTGTPAQLDRAIGNAIARQMIPIIENHDATGNLNALAKVVDWWVTPEIVRVINSHEKYLLVNIANEAGDRHVNQAAYIEAYKTAITRMRRAGIKTLLILDAPDWGQNIDVLQGTAVELTAADPLKNLLFSVHMWWHDPTGERIRSEIQQSVAMNLPLIVGEFAQHAVYQCDQAPFDYSTLLTEAQRHSVGWLAWSWGGMDNGDCANQGSFDMTRGGLYGIWEEPWGEAVAVSHPASIRHTSIRPYSMVTGRCR